MATPSVPAAPPAAPSAPSAPVSSTPSTPATPSPAGGAPSSTPSAAPPQAPKNTDFPGTADGQVAFLAALKKHEATQAAAPAVEQVKSIADNLGAQPAEAKPEGEAKPAEQPKPGEKQPEAKPDATALPKQLADLLVAKPERQAFFDADPELKGAFFGNARRLAAIEPIAEIVPTVADAQFMVEHAAALIGMKTASMRMIDMPETAPQVLDILDQQFAIVDKDGKPVLGADGKPTYAEDHRPFLNAVVGREVNQYKNQFDAERQQLEAKLKSGVYPNEAAKELDQQRFNKLELASLWADMWEQIQSGEFFQTDVPEVPADATPEFKAWAETEKTRLAREKEEIEGKKTGANKEARQAAKQQFNTAVRLDLGSIAGRIIGEELKARIESGVYIPEFNLQEKYRDPTTGLETKTDAIVARIFMDFENELLKPGSRSLMDITQHELLPLTEQTKKIRREYYQRKAAELLPGLIQQEIDRIQSFVKVDYGKLEERFNKRKEVAQAEPNTGGSGLASAASEQQLRAQAEEAASKIPTFANASPGDKQAMILTQLHRMRK